MTVQADPRCGERPLRTKARLTGYLKPGGLFVMAIASDLSGRKLPDRIWYNTLADYEGHFSSFGKKWSVAWHKGVAIRALYTEP